MLGWTLDSFDFTIFLLIMLPIAQESNVRLTDVTFVFRPAGLVDSLLGAYKRHPPNLLLAAAVDPSRWSLGSSPSEGSGVASGHSRASRLTRLYQIRTSQPRDFRRGRNIKSV